MDTKNEVKERKSITPNELAEKAGVSSAYIRRLLGQGVIRAIKHGDGKRGFWEIPMSSAMQWLASRE